MLMQSMEQVRVRERENKVSRLQGQWKHCDTIIEEDDTVLLCQSDHNSFSSHFMESH